MREPYDWKDFRIGDLFKSSTGDVDLQQKDIDGKGVYFINSGKKNFGIKGKTSKSAKTFPRNTITIDFWGNAYFRPFEYKLATHNHVFSLSGDCIKNERVGLFLSVLLSKFSAIFSFDYMLTWTEFKDMSILLPVTLTGDPDFDFMEEYILKLETDYILGLESDSTLEMNAYLKASELDDYALTDEDQNILMQINDGRENFIEFKIGDLFKISTPKKKFNANTVKFNGKYPYVVRSSLNNGIRGYITESEEYLNPANTISFGQDTATMFYQDKPYFTGDKIKIMSLLYHELNKEIACYLISSMARSFSIFAWGQTSFSEKVLNNTIILLPATSTKDPDYDYMERYIRAIEKQVIGQLYEFRRKKIETAKQVINSM